MAVTKEGKVWTWGLNLCGRGHQVALDIGAGKGNLGDNVSWLYTPMQVRHQSLLQMTHRDAVA